MSPNLAETLASARYPASRVEAALADPKEASRVVSAVRAEDEARFREAAVALLRTQPSPRMPSLVALMRPRVEGQVGVLEEQPCDHLASADVSRLVRALLIAAGTLCVALAALGAVLPLLPTVPFLLLAAACYARASERFYRRLLASRTFGPSLTRQ